MEFDVSKVYTAVNADELKPGSKIIVSDNISDLKKYVEEETEEYTIILWKIESGDITFRFRTEDDRGYALAYLIEPPEKKKLKWTDLKIGDVIRKKYVDGYRFGMVTRIDTYSCNDHIELGGEWLSNETLEEWEKVEQEVHND